MSNKTLNRKLTIGSLLEQASDIHSRRCIQMIYIIGVALAATAAIILFRQGGLLCQLLASVPTFFAIVCTIGFIVYRSGGISPPDFYYPERSGIILAKYGRKKCHLITYQSGRSEVRAIPRHLLRYLRQDPKFEHRLLQIIKFPICYEIEIVSGGWGIVFRCQLSGRRDARHFARILDGVDLSCGHYDPAGYFICKMFEYLTPLATSTADPKRLAWEIERLRCKIGRELVETTGYWFDKVRVTKVA